MFVLDEAHEMLNRGFKDQIYEIFQKLNTSIQVKFVSIHLGLVSCRYSYNKTEVFYCRSPCLKYLIHYYLCLALP